MSTWLKGDEDTSRPYREKRLEELLSITGDLENRIMFHAGELSLLNFEELRLCFVQSLDVAVVLLSLTFIERELSAMLFARGRDSVKDARLVQILDWAVEHQLLTSDDHKDFNSLRRTRNAYAHFRPPLHKEGMLKRSVEVEDCIYGITKADAVFAIKAVVSFLKNRPFI